MAQTKSTKAKRSGASKPKAKSVGKPKATQSRAKQSRARSRSASKKSASKNGHRKAATAKAVSQTKAMSQTIGSAGKGAGHATGEAVSKAKIPLLAGGAALMGTVGGVVLGATRSGGKVLGVKLPQPKRMRIRSKDLAKAAKEVGRFGENVGDLTSELKRARQGLADGNGKHDSPIEILLRGLTARR